MEQAGQFAAQATDKLWMPIGLIGVTALSAVLPVPNDEVLHLINTIDKWTAVTNAFTCGLCISTRTFARYMMKPKIYLTVLLINMIVIPVLTEIVTYLLAVYNVIESDDLIEGLIVAVCLPASFRTTVILTLDGYGNETSAIISVLLSKYLGVFTTPFLITVLIGTAELATVRETLWGLNSTVLLPLILGHVVQRLTDFRNERRIPFASLLKVILLINYYVAGSQVSQEIEIYTPQEMMILFITAAVTMTIANLIIAKVSNHMKLDPEPQNTCAIMYASTHKSLHYGILVMKDSTEVPCAVWLYYICQVMVGCFFSLFLKFNVEKQFNNI